MADGVSTTEAARRLQTTGPTVRSLIERGSLRAERQKRGTRFSWLIEKESLDRFLAEHGAFHRARPAGMTVGQLAAEVRDLRESVAALGGAPLPEASDIAAITGERDALRVEVTNLREALLRMRAVAALQRDADAERARVGELVLAATAAAERADALRRQALEQLDEALATVFRPGNAGDIVH
jgi:excisionase family DNA binding protein